ncbi:hypothetical protein ACH5RR_010033 [Cinchona calisaya]|uniref:NTF2 domain-containing protein n=1 Tax=Cinchona calisaya TaxID=153742 RepID=A0ABD3AHM5_9GENT
MAAPVSATQFGSRFVERYYMVLEDEPQHAYQFYRDSSCVWKVEGETIKLAYGIEQINDHIMLLNFIAIGIATINSFESSNGGIIVIVSGFVKSTDFNGQEVINQPPEFIDLENEFDAQPATSVPLQEPPETEASEHVNSVHIEGDDPVKDYSYQEPDQEHNSGVETVEEGIPLEESPAILQSDNDTVPEPLPAVVEPVGELASLSYASVLRIPKGNPATTVSIQPSFNKGGLPPALRPSNPAVVSDIVEDVTEIVKGRLIFGGIRASVIFDSKMPTIFSVDTGGGGDDIGKTCFCIIPRFWAVRCFSGSDGISLQEIRKDFSSWCRLPCVCVSCYEWWPFERDYAVCALMMFKMH